MSDKKESKSFINLGIVFNNKGEVLLVKKKIIEKRSDSLVLQWTFPDGKQRLDETRQESIKRHILSETGYDVQWIRQIDLAFHPEIPIFIAYHLCTLTSPDPVAKPQETHEVAEIRWVQPEEIPNLFTIKLNPKVKQELGLG